MFGMANSYCLNSQSGSYPAAEYCNSYKPVSSGKGSSGWYLPGSSELMKIDENYSAINYTLQKLSGSTQLSRDIYWSSSQDDANQAWRVTIPSNSAMSHDKDIKHRVRCFLTF